ncbi:uncharacterized protein LOC110834682 [Zootermopsis nevadensis]|uniref:uncharacterized protein LOC110834682 n=1 Tax=Zootermopsis nevadensis TaxID=136037 RepID=UPI000B8E8293|nr:uncharacterized protein LOC110834682 [Zootermopsis nevadensis]
MQVWCVVLLVVSLAQADRDARWLLRRTEATAVVEERRTITQTTMSSCIAVAPSLLPCGQPEILPTAPVQIMTTRAASLHEPSRDQRWLTGSTETTGWDEYLGLRRATITDTVTRYETALYRDPTAVVTFSIVGCQPSRLPFDLPYCKTSAPDATTQ